MFVHASSFIYKCIKSWHLNCPHVFEERTRLGQTDKITFFWTPTCLIKFSTWNFLYAKLFLITCRIFLHIKLWFLYWRYFPYSFPKWKSFCKNTNKLSISQEQHRFFNVTSLENQFIKYIRSNREFNYSEHISVPNFADNFRK